MAMVWSDPLASRTVRLCRWRVRVAPLWMWWYTAVVLAIQGYLLYRAVGRCKTYNELPWRTQAKPVVELYVYIGLIVASVMCMPFFIITSLFRIGSYANDGVRLGRDNIHSEELAEASGVNSLSPNTGDSQLPANGNVTSGDDDASSSDSSAVGSEKVIPTLWKHAGPWNHGFHVVSVFCLLLPDVLLQAQEIRHEFVSSDSLWHSELDLIFGRNYIQYGSSGAPRWNSSDATSRSVQWQAGVSPEYVTYILALAVYAVRYPAVYWYTNMSFSLVFSFQAVAIAVYYAFSFCGMAILYKLQVNAGLASGVRVLLPAPGVLGLYLTGNGILYTSTISSFNYGYQQYAKSWKQCLKAYAPRFAGSKGKPPGCQGYVPHVSATAFLLAVIGCRAVIVYDYVSVYRFTNMSLMLACTCMDVIYMVTWLVTWFGFTVKQQWDFRIALARYMVFQQPQDRKREDAQTANGYAVTGTSVTENGHVVTAAEMRNTSNDSSDKMPGTPQRVTLTETAATRELEDLPGNQGTNNNNENTHVADPSSRSDISRRRRRNIEPELNECVRTDPSLPHHDLTDANPDNAESQRQRRPVVNSVPRRLRIFREESTPENTLTRNYQRHIRDKCGQYYSDRDLSPPPAAQSSPVPLDQQDGPEQRLSEGRSPPSYNRERQIPPPPYKAPEGVNLRSKPRPGARANNDSRFSYPPASPLGNSNLQPPPYDFYADRQGRHSFIPQYPAYSLDGSYLPKDNVPHSHSVSQLHLRPPPSRTVNSGRRGPPTRPRPRLPPRMNPNNPELSRRDSALPSSNETSSNDSEDVLCSQV